MDTSSLHIVKALAISITENVMRSGGEASFLPNVVTSDSMLATEGARQQFADNVADLAHKIVLAADARKIEVEKKKTAKQEPAIVG